MFTSPKKGKAHTNNIETNETEVNNNEVRMRVYKSADRKSEYKEEDKKVIVKKRELESIEENPKRYKKYDGLDDLLYFAKQNNLCKKSYRIMITGNTDLIRYIEVNLERCFS
jgi:hypothetical protein